MEEIISFLDKKKVPGYGMNLLRKEDCIELIKLCQKNSVRVFGFDGFIIHPNYGVQIEQDYSRDYSKFSSEQAAQLSLEYFSKDRSENVLYEISFGKGNFVSREEKEK